MRVTEIFDTPTSFDEVENRKSYYDYQFQIADKTYRVFIGVNAPRKAFDVQFMRLGTPSKHTRIGFNTDVESIFNDLTVGQTLSILTHTIDALKMAFKERPNYKRILFVADKDQPSRVRLYNRLAKTLADKFGGTFSARPDRDYINYEITL